MIRFFKKYKLAVDVGFVIVALIASFAEWYDFFVAEDKWRWMLGTFYTLIVVAKLFDMGEDLRKKKNLQSQSDGISNTLKNE